PDQNLQSLTLATSPDAHQSMGRSDGAQGPRVAATGLKAMGNRAGVVPCREPADPPPDSDRPPPRRRDEHHRRHRMIHRRRHTYRPHFDHLDDRCLPAALSPSQLEAAYGLSTSSTAGAGKTIAVIDAFNDPNIAAELAAFDGAYGLPGTSANISNYL